MMRGEFVRVTPAGPYGGEANARRRAQQAGNPEGLGLPLIPPHSRTPLITHGNPANSRLGWIAAGQEPQGVRHDQQGGSLVEDHSRAELKAEERRWH